MIEKEQIMEIAKKYGRAIVEIDSTFDYLITIHTTQFIITIHRKGWEKHEKMYYFIAVVSLSRDFDISEDSIKIENIKELNKIIKFYLKQIKKIQKYRLKH